MKRRSFIKGLIGLSAVPVIAKAGYSEDHELLRQLKDTELLKSDPHGFLPRNEPVRMDNKGAWFSGDLISINEKGVLERAIPGKQIIGVYDGNNIVKFG